MTTAHSAETYEFLTEEPIGGVGGTAKGAMTNIYIYIYRERERYYYIYIYIYMIKGGEGTVD